MHRFFCPDLAAGQGLSEFIATLDRDESRHVVNALRLKVNDEVSLFNGQGVDAIGRVVSTAKPGVQVKVATWLPAQSQGPTVVIASAIPKGPRADAMIQQLSQVGATQLIPLHSERSVVKPGDGKLDKFRRAALESAKQCGRSILMDIAESQTFADVLRSEMSCRLIAHATGTPMQEVIAQPPDSTLILVGPEGGWTDDEQSQAAAAGFKAVWLGPHIMRIETAAVIAAAMCQQSTENTSP